ncbi:MAG: C25 family cysteine peptidase [Bacteroidota bacterium]|nr:C25 family cysteine peptidase [Bacteroidota bacterium]
MLLLSICFSVFAGEIRMNQEKTEVRFTPGKLQTLTFTSTLSSVQFREVLTSAGTFTELYVPGYNFSNIPGDPKLPVYHKLIEIPLEAGVEVNILNAKYQEYDMGSNGIVHPVIPAQPPVSKNITDPSALPLVYNDSTYKSNRFTGGPVASVTPVGILRSVRLGRLDISPVWYNPVTQKLRIYESFEVQIVFTHPDTYGTTALMRNTYSPAFNNLFTKIPNLYAPDTLLTGGPMTYVIVSDPMFSSVLQPFIHWKEKKGFRVIAAYTNDPNVGNSKTSIRNYLMNLYNNPPSGYARPTFVLLVGDVAQIPAWTDNSHPSDLKYCEYTNDNIPEVFYGRFSANNLAQVQPYIDKAMEYEQYSMPDDSFLGNASLVAGADATNGPLYGNGQVNYGRNTYFNTAHNLNLNYYLQPEPSGANYSQRIRQDVSNGVCFSNYSAHGSESGWADPQFVISQIPALTNDHKYPLMIGNCCKTANFGTNCFAEEITRAANKGALGYIGCSDYSYWDEDFWWADGFKSVSTNPQYNSSHLGAYDVTFHDHGEAMDNWYVTMGQMIMGGNLAVEESNSSMKRYYWETYCLMGDPSLSVYYSVPSAMTATYPGVITTQDSVVTITTEPYAYVALAVHDSVLLDARTADAQGVASLSFSPLPQNDTLSLVITKQNRKPFFGSIVVIPGNVPYIIFSSYTINDSIGGNNDHTADYGESILLNVSVRNLGPVASGMVTGTLSTQDTNVVITADTHIFGIISGGETITGYNAFGLTIKQNVPDQHIVPLTLSLTDGSSAWISEMNLTLNAPFLTLGQLTVLDPAPGGNNNGVLDPGESVTLKLKVSNTGHAPVSNAISHVSVTTGSGYILLNNPVYFLGTLVPGAIGSSYAYTDALTNGATPPGTLVSLNYLVTAGAQDQYSVNSPYDLEIGEQTAYPMAPGTISTCSGVFYDTGGPDQNYGSNEDITETFTSGTSGAQIQMNFTSFDVESGTNCTFDKLTIYNGPTISSPLIGTYCGTDSPGIVVSTNGSLTYQFHSDYSSTYSGWAATISCIGGPLSIVANGFPATVCHGASSQLSAIPSGGSGNYTYQWSPANYLSNPTSSNPISTPESDITYTVMVSDGSSQITSAPVTLTVHPAPAAPVITENGDLLISSAAHGNQWYINDALIPGETGQTLVPVASGSYYAVVIDSITGCQSDPSNILPYFFTGINPASGDEKVTVYPNPVRNMLNIRYTLPSSGPVKISLYNGQGNTVRTIADNASQHSGNYLKTIDMYDLSSGIYYLRITSDDYTLVRKILFNKE